MIDHFYLFSAGLQDCPAKEEILSEEFKLTVKARRDLTFKPIDQDYTSRLVMFVFPDGLQILDQDLRVANDPSPQKTYSKNLLNSFPLIGFNKQDALFTFITTNQNNERSYCTCLTTYQKRLIRSGSRKKAKIMKCKLSQLKDRIVAQQNQSQYFYIPKAFLLMSSCACLQLQVRLLTFLYVNFIASLQTVNISYSFQKLCLFQQQVQKFGIYFAMDAQVQKSYQNIENELSDSDFAPLIVYLVCRIQLKQGLSLFHLPGLGDSLCQTFVVRGQPHRSEISNIFKVFTMKNLIKLIKNIILQKQILIFSNNLAGLPIVLQQLLYFVRPLVWQATYIPVLPMHIWKAVDVIGGHIIGIHKNHQNFIIQNITSMRQKVIIDLQQHILIEKGQASLDQLPSQLQQFLTEKISLSLKQDSSVGKFLSVKSIFLTFLIKIIGNVNCFFQEGEFDLKSYLNSVNQKYRNFVQTISKTIMFSWFLQRLQQTPFDRLSFQEQIFYNLASPLQTLKYIQDAHRIPAINSAMEFLQNSLLNRRLHTFQPILFKFINLRSHFKLLRTEKRDQEILWLDLSLLQYMNRMIDKQ